MEHERQAYRSGMASTWSKRSCCSTLERSIATTFFAMRSAACFTLSNALLVDIEQGSAKDNSKKFDSKKKVDLRQSQHDPLRKTCWSVCLFGQLTLESLTKSPGRQRQRGCPDREHRSPARQSDQLKGQWPAARSHSAEESVGGYWFSSSHMCRNFVTIKTPPRRRPTRRLQSGFRPWCHLLSAP